MTITEFLMQRIAEDEANLPRGFDCWYDPERYAAECEAKRRIVGLHKRLGDESDPAEMVYHEAADSCVTCGYGDEWQAKFGGSDWPCPTLRALAAVFADHPDFREEWKL